MGLRIATFCNQELQTEQVNNHYMESANTVSNHASLYIRWDGSHIINDRRSGHVLADIVSHVSESSESAQQLRGACQNKNLAISP